MDPNPLMDKDTDAAELLLESPTYPNACAAAGKRVAALLRLTRATISLRASHASLAALALGDVVGASSSGATLTVQAWPLASAASGKRVRSVLEFSFPAEGGTAAAAAWAQLLGALAREGGLPACLQQAAAAQGSGGAAEAGHSGPLAPLLSAPPPPLPLRRLLVYVNPVAGSGRGVAMLAEVEPLLRAAGLELSTVVLSSRGQPTRALAAMPAEELAAYEGILAVGGDGSLSEVVEGLMARRDWAPVLARLRLGLLPSGSGNGLAISLAVASGQPASPWTCALAVAKGGSTPVDLASTFVLWGSGAEGSGGALAEEGAAGGGVQLNPLWASPLGGAGAGAEEDAGAGGGAAAALRRDGLWGARRFSFLSLEWAIVADIDIESESLRYLGAARFDVYGLIRCLCLRRYRGRFSYLPPAAAAAAAAAAAGASGSSTSTGASLPPSPSANPSLPSSDSGALPTLQHLVPFDHALPPTWRSIEGVFTLLWAVNSSHQSAGVSISPQATHRDGQWTVVLMRDRGVCGITGAMLALDMAGSVASAPGIETFSCLAWRLEPEVGGEIGIPAPASPSAAASSASAASAPVGSPRAPPPRPAHTGVGNVCLDGEGVAYGPVQGEVHPGLLNVYSCTAQQRKA